ncbi:cell wall-binding repeat-containing protein [Candidatus Poriferisodalis sp.]|uniref:cell wall-binding repeat-containing protein n=1 Tax=Candidatus Poriferisodalis sp. TaxID=3101277 RepID=UPI003B027D37
MALSGLRCPDGQPKTRLRSGRRRGTRQLLVISMVAAALTAGAVAPVTAAERVNVERHWGQDRYETAAEIAEEFTTASSGVDTVIVASGLAFADALAATPLARVRNAPILLTEPDELPPATRDFIDRNGIRNVIIAGGTESVSDDVSVALGTLTRSTPERLEGSSRFRTVARIAREVAAGGIGDFCDDGRRTVLLATGATFADALALSPLAFAGPHPVLLTEPDRLVGPAQSFLDDFDVEQVVVAGGPAAIHESVTDDIADRGIAVRRFWGQDRFATAVEVAEALTGRCFEADEFGLADGWKFPDAMVGGTILGQRKAPLLLSEPLLPDATRQFLAGSVPDADDVLVTVLGGPAAVAESAADEAVGALRGDDRDCDPFVDVPGAPRDLTIEPRDEGLVVSWRPPESSRGSAPDSYTVRYRAVGEADWQRLGDVTSPLEIDGLANKTLYEVRVRALGSGYGGWTPSGFATPSNAAGVALYTATTDCVPAETT